MSPTMFSWQAATSGKTEARRSSLRIRWICGGTFLPPWKRNSASERLASQRQRVEDRRCQRGLLQDLLHSLGLQIVENIAERKAVLLGQCDIQPVVGCGSLQLKIER